jgi:4-hydroxythreonine-4-phosphate dehydrogenase
MSRLPIVLTMGEPAGIGPELAGQAWLDRASAALDPFYSIANPDFLAGRFAATGIDVPIKAIASPHDAEAVFGVALPVIPLEKPVVSGQPGEPSVKDAPGVLESIERAVANVIDGAACAVVTAPVQKETLYTSGFEFPGHTEFLGELAQRRGLSARPVMMIASDELRVVPVTIHVPISTVPGLLDIDAIVETAEIVASELSKRFGIDKPRLAVAGLNPHAGEGGRIGSEDRDVIAPAVERLRAGGIDATGPQAADTLFHAAARSRYDAAICMYHDQALIPIKTVAFEDAVNVTLGLPFVRTSPDHGTALTLAGTGKANPSSLIAAIQLARHMALQG